MAISSFHWVRSLKLKSPNLKSYQRNHTNTKFLKLIFDLVWNPTARTYPEWFNIFLLRAQLFETFIFSVLIAPLLESERGEGINSYNDENKFYPIPGVNKRWNMKIMLLKWYLRWYFIHEICRKRFVKVHSCNNQVSKSQLCYQRVHSANCKVSWELLQEKPQ